MGKRLEKLRKWWFKPKWMGYSDPICAQALLGAVFLVFAMPSGSGVCFFLAIFGMMPLLLYIILNPTVLVGAMVLWGNPMIFYG